MRAKVMFAGIAALLAVSLPVLGAPTYAPPKGVGQSASIQSNSFMAVSSPSRPDKMDRRIEVVVTAYSSTPEETDDTPFITANGTHVKQGIVAANFLPFGTKVRIPSVYGDRIFTVEDRMHPRKIYQIDIWFADSQAASDFGAKYTEIEVLGS